MSLNRNSSIRSFNTLGQQMTLDGHYPMGPYFQAWELACHGEVDGQHIMRCHDGFIIELTFLRKRVGKPFIINSCCRTPQHNKDEGGHPRSLHLTENPVHPTSGSMAVDLNVNGWTIVETGMLIALAWSFGWSIGRGEHYNDDGITFGFVHLDRRIEIGLKQVEFHYD